MIGADADIGNDNRRVTRKLAFDGEVPFVISWQIHLVRNRNEGWPREYAACSAIDAQRIGAGARGVSVITTLREQRLERVIGCYRGCVTAIRTPRIHCDEVSPLCRTENVEADGVRKVRYQRAHNLRREIIVEDS